MTLTHEQARQYLQVAVDGSLEARQQAELDRHLADCAECQAYAQEIASLDTRLSRVLQARWPDQTRTEADQAYALGRIQSQSRSSNLRNTASAAFRTLAWAGLAVSLIILLSWSIRNLTPRPAAEGSSSPTPAGLGPATDVVDVSPDRTPDVPLETPTPQPALVEGAGLFPAINFQFAIDFPAAPEQLAIYSQQLPEQLTSESARQMAERLGITGNVYPMPSEGFDETWIEVSDGFDVARFSNFAEQFVYFPQTADQVQGSTELYPFEQQVEVVKSFLEEHGLLNFPYRAEALESGDGIRFLRLLDGYPVIYGIGDNPGLMEWIRASVNNTGEITEIDYSNAEFQLAGEFPILSAKAAWERLSSGQATQRSQYAIQASPQPSTLQTWNRSYPVGQTVDLYGYVGIIQPVDPEAQPAVWFNNLSLTGNVQSLIDQSPMGQFLHLQGKIEENQAGKRRFEVSDWEVSPLPEEFLMGVIQKQDDQFHLVTEDGRVLLLADIPENVPDGTQVEARGVELVGEPSILDWWYISTGQPASSGYGAESSCLGAGGGGGGDSENANFGGGVFSLPNLSGQSLPPPTQASGIVQVGQRIEEMVGTVYIAVYQPAGGEQRREVSIWVEPTGEIPQYQEFLLEGNLPDETNAFQSLPVKVTGEVSRYQENRPVITVERVDPLYPGLEIQAWIGTQEAVTLEDQPAMLFNTEDGQTFVLKHSIGSGEESRIGLPGDRVIIEGLAIPGQTFGGYPVLQEMSAETTSEGEDLSSYEITSNQPVVMDGLMGGAPDLSTLEGTVTINEIELVYSAISLRHCIAAQASNPDLPPYLVVQPVWRFQGVFDDGRLFEVQVQALPDEFLR